MISDGRLHTNIKRIFRDGYLAFKRGDLAVNSPYLDKGDKQLGAWVAGWRKAELQQNGKLIQ